MEAPATPIDEPERLDAVRALGLLDTTPEARFDRVTRLASRLFDAPIALFSLVDEDRQFFKSRHGVDTTELPREISVCGHTILGDDILVIPDALADDRFADNPLVTVYPQVRFYAGCPVRTPEGRRVGTLCVLDHRPRDFDAADRATLADLGAMIEQELATVALARTDALTGLHNRRGLEAVAQHAVALARRQHLPISLLFVDLDDFKQVNDELGHAAGDRVLREMATLLLAVFRRSDVVARVGGDEFAILMTGTAANGAAAAVRRLGDAVARHNRSTERRFDLAYSTGVVTCDGDDVPTIDELMDEADRRMYREKRRRGVDTTSRELALVLLQLAGSLTAAEPYGTRMTRLCEEVVRLVGCARSSIFTMSGNAYRASFEHGGVTDLTGAFTRLSIPAADPLVGTVMGSGHHVVVDDVATSSLARHGQGRWDATRSMAIAPLLAAHEPLGFMTAEYTDASDGIGELDVTLLVGVARLAAGVMLAERGTTNPATTAPSEPG